MTTSKPQSLQSALTKANPNSLPDALKKVDLGLMLAVVKVTFSGLPSSATQDITTAVAKAAATIVGIDLDSGQNLPAVGSIETCRVAAGAAAAGNRQMTDAGGTATTTVAKISDDGKTFTFEAAVTGFVLTYRPRASAVLTADFGTLV